MADNEKAKSAKERLAAAKRAAVDAEVTDNAPEPTAADDEARDHAIEGALNAAEGSDSKAIPADSDRDIAETAKATQDPAPVEEPVSRPLSATLLTWLVIFLIGAFAALAIGPRIAPSLPEPIAKFLMPGATKFDASIARLEASNAETVAALTQRLNAMEADLADQSALSAAIAEVEGRLSTEIEAVADAPKQDLSAIEATINEVAGRVTAVEATLQGLRTELDALAGVSGENAAPSAETLARVAAFGATVEGLRSEVAALSNRTSEIDSLAAQEQVTSLVARIDALEGGEAATTSAREEADDIRRSANLDAALTGIDQALAAGQPFAEPLSTAVSLSGEPAPATLSAVASSGAPTTDSLTRSFGVAAQNAYAAAVESDAGEGFTNRLLARLEGRVGGRPAAETEGDDAGAVLSRIEARLGEGRLGAARDEAANLPEAASAAMAGWLASLERADEARKGLTQWRAALGAN